jgi:hypothetical protein
MADLESAEQVKHFSDKELGSPVSPSLAQG